ncbi:hypothetical protein ACLHGA_000809, partial [Escherichia coli]
FFPTQRKNKLFPTSDLTSIPFSFARALKRDLSDWSNPVKQIEIEFFLGEDFRGGGQYTD